MSTSAGHLRIPNDLVEILARLHLNGTQWQILWAIWRRTLCWQQPGEWGNRSHPIGVSDLVDATGLNESQVKREMAELVDFNIVLRDKSPDGQPSPGGRGRKTLTSFNLDISTWKVQTKGSQSAPLSGLNTVAERQPFSIQNGSEVAPLSDAGKGSQSAPLSAGKGSQSAPQTVAEEQPFNDKKATLSPFKPKLLKKHIKKHIKTDIDINKEKKTYLGNVHMTEDDYNKLVERFGTEGATDRIEGLSLYIKSKGAEHKYKDHYATILNWERMNKGKEKRSGEEKGGGHGSAPGRGPDAHRTDSEGRGKYGGFKPIKSGPTGDGDED